MDCRVVSSVIAWKEGLLMMVAATGEQCATPRVAA